MKISNRAKLIRPSLTRKLFNMAKEYDNVIDLTLGDPDLSPPEKLADVAYQTMKNNQMHYSLNAGIKEARQAVAKHIKNVWGIDCDYNENIILTVGGMEALYLALLSIVDPGDEVIIFAPYYVNYMQMVEMCGGKAIVVNVYNENGLTVNKRNLEQVITDKTVAVIVNSPNNPTGDVFDRTDLNVIAEVAKENELMIISDEVYRTLIYDDRKHESILNSSESINRTILVDSLSKEYSMTGWRIGYSYGPKEITQNMIKLQENIAACANVSSQYALAEAYDNAISNEYIRIEFENRRNFLYEEITKIDKLIPIKPKATFYMFINIKNTGLKSEEFAYWLLENAHIAVVPGVAYGAMYDDYVRIAFTKEISVLSETIRRLKKVL